MSAAIRIHKKKKKEETISRVKRRPPVHEPLRDILKGERRIMKQGGGL